MVAVQSGVGILLIGEAHRFYEKLQAARDRGIGWVEACFDYGRAEERVRARRPDVLFLALQLPGTAEYELTTHLRTDPPAPPLVAGCPTMADCYLVLAISLGAAALVTIDVSPTSLAQTLRMAGNGKLSPDHGILGRLELAPQVREWLRELPPSAGGVPSRNPLSRREQEVLRVVSRGYSNQEVGDLLSIQEQTVKNHLSSILRKTHARERFQAAARALRHGWIPLR